VQADCCQYECEAATVVALDVPSRLPELCPFDDDSLDPLHYG